MSISKVEKKIIKMKDPLAHYIPLWILVLFTFLVVCISTMGGAQKGLPKRYLPDTGVNGDLEVTGATRIPGRLVNFPSMSDVEVIPDQQNGSVQNITFGDSSIAQFQLLYQFTRVVPPDPASNNGLLIFNLPRPTLEDVGKKFIFYLYGGAQDASPAGGDRPRAQLRINVGAANTALPDDLNTIFVQGSTGLDVGAGAVTTDNRNRYSLGYILRDLSSSVGFGNKIIVTAVGLGQYLLETVSSGTRMNNMSGSFSTA